MSNLNNHKKSISVVMISNSMNHHQFPFCDSMFKADGVDFRFLNRDSGEIAKQFRG
mgnify:CR=1 FL=1